MNKKPVSMLILCTMCWAFGILSILIKTYSIIGYWVLFGFQMACLAGLLITFIWNIRSLRKQEKELEIKIQQNKKEIDEMFVRILSTTYPENLGVIDDVESNEE